MVIYDIGFAEEKLYVSNCYLENKCKVSMFDMNNEKKTEKKVVE